MYTKAVHVYQKLYCSLFQVEFSLIYLLMWKAYVSKQHGNKYENMLFNLHALFVISTLVSFFTVVALSYCQKAQFNITKHMYTVSRRIAINN